MTEPCPAEPLIKFKIDYYGLFRQCTRCDARRMQGVQYYIRTEDRKVYRFAWRCSACDYVHADTSAMARLNERAPQLQPLEELARLYTR